jgi:hypothetical protein
VYPVGSGGGDNSSNYAMDGSGDMEPHASTSGAQGQSMDYMQMQTNSQRVRAASAPSSLSLMNMIGNYPQQYSSNGPTAMYGGGGSGSFSSAESRSVYPPAHHGLLIPYCPLH